MLFDALKKRRYCLVIRPVGVGDDIVGRCVNILSFHGVLRVNPA